MTRSEKTTLIVALGALLAVLGLIVAVQAKPRTLQAATPVWTDIAPPMEQSLLQWRWIVLHHSASPAGDAETFDRIHTRDRGWDGIGYHFVVGNGSPMPMGGIEATFRWRGQQAGAHAGPGPEQKPYNQFGIGICLVGDFSNHGPDRLQERRAAELCAVLIHQIPSLSLTRIIGHREVPGKHTVCPGRLDIDRIRFLARQHLEANGWTAR